ncbi:HD-GYP domain-containing protein [Pontibacillus sp. HMF3514]|uniref:HD-GYP domain-containing protein n=1 Tax=Pontibacillus sp. HMF3514 TaxID=2692425 RepID=UPI00131F7E3A|nr:HDIG domain-containing metalloprotein [Pontibacillus sp. HMF3514]QHE53691.1 HDIG domain-containing protein [Pontibacillus sp. HMF3514]
MRLINVSEYNYENMVLAKPVYDSKKRILIAAGKSINPRVLDRVKNMGVSYLFIEDEISKGIDIEDMLDMPKWTDCIQTIKEYFEQAQNEDAPNILPIQKVADQLIEEVKKRPTLVTIPSGAIDQELQPYAHAVNVTILSLLTAKKMGYNNIQMKELALGTLLHDIGKAITDEYSNHQEEGFNHLRSNRQISLMSAHIAYQHHETIDGKGAPRQLTEVLEVGQIAGVANNYENHISKEQLLPHQAMEAIMATSDVTYSFGVVQAFSQAVPTYPPGTKVIIASKEDGIVTRVQQHLQRPVVRVLSKGRDIDLADHPTLMIEPM